MIVSQILLVSTLRNVLRTVRRICILTLGCKGLTWLTYIYTKSLFTSTDIIYKRLYIFIVTDINNIKQEDIFPSLLFAQFGFIQEEQIAKQWQTLIELLLFRSTP